jgi:hypothetical protein
VRECDLDAVQIEEKVGSWKNNRDNQSKHDGQLKWEAEVVQYVEYIHRETSTHGNAGPTVARPNLKKEIPLLGPCFLPPSYQHAMRRETTPKIIPDTAYLKPLTIIHPFYQLGLSQCPQCDSTEILWDGWTSTGAREVHGLRREERALGYQLRCKKCKAKYGKGGSNEHEKKPFCFATTSKMFWQKWEHWKIPRESLFTIEVSHTLAAYQGRSLIL